MLRFRSVLSLVLAASLLLPSSSPLPWGRRVLAPGVFASADSFAEQAVVPLSFGSKFTAGILTFVARMIRIAPRSADIGLPFTRGAPAFHNQRMDSLNASQERKAGFSLTLEKTLRVGTGDVN